MKRHLSLILAVLAGSLHAQTVSFGFVALSTPPGWWTSGRTAEMPLVLMGPASPAEGEKDAQETRSIAATACSAKDPGCVPACADAAVRNAVFPSGDAPSSIALSDGYRLYRRALPGTVTEVVCGPLGALSFVVIHPNDVEALRLTRAIERSIQWIEPDGRKVAIDAYAFAPATDLTAQPAKPPIRKRPTECPSERDQAQGREERLIVAAKCGDLEEVRRQVEAGARIDVNGIEICAEATTPLCESGLALKAGLTPLCFAAGNADVPLVEYLLAKSADPNTKTPASLDSGTHPNDLPQHSGLTPLFFAIGVFDWTGTFPDPGGMPEARHAIVKLLLHAGADPRVTVREGGLIGFAIMHAGWQQEPLYFDVAETLMRAGADPNARGTYDTTAVWNFAQYHDLDFVKPRTPTSRAETTRKVLDMFKRYGADFNLRENNMWHPCLLDVYWEDEEFRNQLIEHGARKCRG